MPICEACSTNLVQMRAFAEMGLQQVMRIHAASVGCATFMHTHTRTRTHTHTYPCLSHSLHLAGSFSSKQDTLPSEGLSGMQVHMRVRVHVAVLCVESADLQLHIACYAPSVFFNIRIGSLYPCAGT